MIQSMTGFGQASCELDDKRVNIEIKSLNSKQFDLYLRLPGAYRDKELDIRNELSNKLRRGKIDVSFFIEYKEGSAPAQINAGVVKSYFLQLKDILDDLEINTGEIIMQSILRLPEALNNGKQAADPDEWQKVMLALADAAEALGDFRKLEGAAIEKDMLMRIGLIESLLLKIEPFEKERHDAMKGKLMTAMAQMNLEEKIDQNRFEQEMVYYLEKLDITEEKTRLKHHCSYFKDVIAENEQVGRKLSFIVQEIGREINTLGSKANHAEIQRTVVMMKDELEKIKEQLLNVL